MTTSTVEPTADTTEDNTTPVFEKGTWEHTLQLSVQADDKSKSAKILAGKRLRAGAWAAVGAFLADAGADADALYNRVKATGLSASTASKIKKIAVTARDFPEYGWSEVPLGAVDGTLPKVSDPKMSLNKADALARKLTDAPAAEAAEDSAFEAVIEAVSEVAPKTSTTVEGLLQIALVKAGDSAEFVKVLIDVLSGPTGIHNAEACQAFIREFAAENGSRIKAAKPEKVATVKRTAGDGAAKAKAAPAKAASAKPKPAKAAPVEAEADPMVAATEDAEPDVDLTVQPDELDWDDIETEAPVEDAAPVAQNVTKAKAAPVKTKATPIKRV